VPSNGNPVLFHPDYTVGPGISPGLLTLLPLYYPQQALAGYTRNAPHLA
jgi:hypothetical protein